MTTYTINPKFNGIEISFDSIPSASIRSTLKANGFRWFPARSIWYAKQTPERLDMVKALVDGKEAKKEAKQAAKPEAAPSHSLRVGDLLYSSWGYEQTNIDFYQVIALKGKTMVTVKKCYPEVVKTEAVSGMSQNVSFKAPAGIIAPEDDEPLTRKVKNFSKDNNPAYDLIDITSYASASKYNGQTLYESWYY